MKKIGFISLMLAVFASAQVFGQTYQENDVCGIWLNQDKDAHIKIYRDGTNFLGKIIWMKNPIDPETGKPKLDKNNPEDNLQSRPLDGLIIIRDFTWDAGNQEWEDGEIYDPKNGKTYSCEMNLENENTLEVRGYVGFSWIGRTVVWTRLENSPGLEKYPD